jgi:glycosyltransferase involved in cell wall biosynthesis
MFDKKIGIITPWFGRFAGGAELLARGMARELNKRGIPTIVFTTCSLSPYDSWWQDHYEPGVYDVEGIQTRRFATGKVREPYDAAIAKITRGKSLSSSEQEDFFNYGINSDDLVQSLGAYVNDEYELIALPYFHGLTHSAINYYPKKISLTPCFHDERQFYWPATERLLANSKHIFFNSHEEKQLTIKHYGRRVGRRVVESVVAGVGVELLASNGAGDEKEEQSQPLPDRYFVYAGRKERGKNVHLLCEWFDEYAREQQGNTKLVFIGGGDASLVPANNRFLDLGFVSEPRKLEVMKNSFGVINLSENESFSIVIMEGWLSGVPSIVSANCAVTRDHVSRCNGGLFVASKDEFNRALRYLEDHETIRHRLAENGRQYLAREFSFDVVLGRYLGELGRSALLEEFSRRGAKAQS